MQISALIARIVLRQTIGAVSRSERYRRVWLTVSVAAICFSATAFLAIRLASPQIQVLPASVVLPIAVVSIQLLVALVTLTTTTSVIDESTLLRVCRPLPISNAAIAAGIAAPVIGVVAALSVLLMPAAAALLVAMTSVAWPTIIVIYVAAVAAGLVWGLILACAARLLVAVTRTSRILLYPTGLLLASGYALVEIISVNPGVSVRPAAWIGGVPAIVGLASSPEVVSPTVLVLSVAIVLTVVFTGFCWAALWLSPREQEGRPVFRWGAGRPTRLVELELIRLLRHPRIAGSMCAIGVVIAGTFGVLTRLPAGSWPDYLGGLLVAVAVALSHPGLLARGYSDRLPQQIQILGEPARWVLRMNAAVGALVLAPVALVVVLSAVVAGEAGYAVFALGVSAFATTAGYLVGTLLPVGRNNVSGEVVGLGAVGIGVYAFLSLVGHFIPSPLDLGVCCMMAALVVVLASMALEQRRWIKAVGNPVPGSTSLTRGVLIGR
jgi:hypothetical protein